MSKINFMHIYEAYTKDKPVDEEWYKDRMNKCHNCPSNSINVFEKTFGQKVRESVGSVVKKLSEPYCTLCSCPIANKCSVKAVSCPASPPLWTSLEASVYPQSNEPKIYKVLQSPESITSIGISDEMGRTVLELGDHLHGPVEFTFEVRPPKGFVYSNHHATCGCTVAESSPLEDGGVKISSKLSLAAFEVGVKQRKTIQINFINEENREHNLPISIQVKKIVDGL